MKTPENQEGQMKGIPDKNVIRHKQSGVALIIVMLIFFMISLLTTEIMMRQRLEGQKAIHYTARAQSHMYAVGAEYLARRDLYKDYEDDQRNSLFRDYYQEQWYKEPEPYDLDQDGETFGELYYKLSDLQSGFNINGLLTDTNQKKNYQNALIKLLETLDVSDAHAITEEVYLHLQKTQRPMAHVSELRLLETVSEEDYAVISPCLVALPPTTKLNLNTAAEIILKAWGDFIPNNILEDIISIRVGGLEVIPPLPDNSYFSISSEYFLLRITADFNERNYRMLSVLHRSQDDGYLQVVSRDLSAKFQIFEDREECTRPDLI